MVVRRSSGWWLVCFTALIVGEGCCGPQLGSEVRSGLPVGDPESNVPRELEKVTLPTYRVEPPDILLIDAIRVIPRPPYRIDPLDALFISVPNALPIDPIRDVYPVDPDGMVNLGKTYGRVKVSELTLEEAQKAIAKQLRNVLKQEPDVTVNLAQSKSIQDIRGQHLVGIDGTIRLGVYGSVRVTGMTLDEAKHAIESHLSKFLVRPEVSVDVFSYNSKVYYVVTDGGGNGEQVLRFPLTGNETVLDAVSNIAGLPPVASKKRIWLARPAPPGCPRQHLPVHWDCIVRDADPTTNYQLVPGDRIYVMAKPLVTVDTALARALSPIERMFGVTLLGSTTVRSFRNNGNQGFGTGFGF